MNYFKHLDLDWKPAARKLKIIFQRSKMFDYSTGAWITAPDSIIELVPELPKMFDPLGLEILTVGLFVSTDRVGLIHTDATDIAVRINFPVMNCNNTETKFFTIKEGTPTEYKMQPNGNPYRQLRVEDCVEVDKFELTQATAMRVLEPHQVIVNHYNLPRVSCTVSFKQDISYLLD